MYPCSWVMYAVVHTGSMIVRFECGATRRTLPACSALAFHRLTTQHETTAANPIRTPADRVFISKPSQCLREYHYSRVADRSSYQIRANEGIESENRSAKKAPGRVDPTGRRDPRISR